MTIPMSRAMWRSTDNQIEAQAEWEQCGDGGTVQPGQWAHGVQCHAAEWGSDCPGGSDCYPSNQWIIKNDLEFKNTQRILIDGNYIGNSWPSGQDGASTLWEPAAGESGNVTKVEDVTFTNNIVHHAPSALTLAGQDYNCIFPLTVPPSNYPNCNNAPRTQRSLVQNNLLVTTGTPDGTNHNNLALSGDDSEMIFNHNTGVTENGSFPSDSFNFGAAGFGTPSPSIDNFDPYNVIIENNYWPNNPGGDSDTLPYYDVAYMGWYEHDPSSGTGYVGANLVTGNVFTVPTGNNCPPASNCLLTWNSNSNLPNNTAVYPGGTAFSACGSYGNYSLITPDWSGHTTDLTQAGVDCVALCNTGVCGGAGVLTVISTSPPNGTTNVTYSYSLAAEGGTLPYTWALSAGGLPPGLGIVGSVIAGTPTTAGTFNFTVKVTDAANNTATANLSIQIVTPLQILTTSPLPPAVENQFYSTTLIGSGGSGTLSWSVMLSSLPTGLSLNASTGVISGTPSVFGTESFDIKLSDSLGDTPASQFFQLVITSSGGNQNQAAAAESLTVSDALTRTLRSSSKSAAESLNASDSVARLLHSNTKTAAESLALGDALARGLRSSNRAAAEGLSLSDAVTRSVQLSRAQTESLAVNDSVTAGHARAAAIAEALALGDALARGLRNASKSAAESLNASDAATRSLQGLRSQTEALAVNDSVTAGHARAAAIAEALGVSDALSRWLTSGRFAYEGLSLGDVVMTGSHHFLSAAVSESLAVNSAVIAIYTSGGGGNAYVQASSGQLTLGDGLQAFKQSGGQNNYMESEPESLLLADQVTAMRNPHGTHVVGAHALQGVHQIQ